MSFPQNAENQYQIDMLADKAGGYFSLPTEEGMEYCDLFFSICRQFGIQYQKATPKERSFVEEVTRVMWAIQHGETAGKTGRAAFSA